MTKIKGLSLFWVRHYNINVLWYVSKCTKNNFCNAPYWKKFMNGIVYLSGIKSHSTGSCATESLPHISTTSDLYISMKNVACNKPSVLQHVVCTVADDISPQRLQWTDGRTDPLTHQHYWGISPVKTLGIM